ncbi:Protein of unknown function [Gryllus bimaculatus]|nr:Protein of unknown function [Gryllus bimaculatus]
MGETSSAALRPSAGPQPFISSRHRCPSPPPPPAPRDGYPPAGRSGFLSSFFACGLFCQRSCNVAAVRGPRESDLAATRRLALLIHGRSWAGTRQGDFHFVFGSRELPCFSAMVQRYP